MFKVMLFVVAIPRLSPAKAIAAMPYEFAYVAFIVIDQNTTFASEKVLLPAYDDVA